jgi:hypothetical protein
VKVFGKCYSSILRLLLRLDNELQSRVVTHGGVGNCRTVWHLYLEAVRILNSWEQEGAEMVGIDNLSLRAAFNEESVAPRQTAQ